MVSAVWPTVKRFPLNWPLPWGGRRRRSPGNGPAAAWWPWWAATPAARAPMLAAALSAGICSAGGDVVDLGVITTPGVAFVTTHLKADFGVMISASHNPAPDNGIKFFSADGYKLPDEAEDQLEALVKARRRTPCRAPPGRPGQHPPEPGGGGGVRRVPGFHRTAR